MYPIKYKSDAFDRFRVLAAAERQAGSKPQNLQSDRGEYLSENFTSFLKARDIVQ